MPKAAWRRHRRSVALTRDLNLNESKKCEICSVKFFKPQFYSWEAWTTKKYCSRKCYWTTVSQKTTGKSYPCKNKGLGKGWLHKHSGYRVLAHPVTGKKILEHRYVMECKLGRELAKDEHVHHVNHNKSDNRCENLVVLTSKEHRSLHCKETYMGFNKGKTIIICQKCGGRFFSNPCH